MTVHQALSGFYAENDFEDDGGVQSQVAWLKVGPFKVPIPNPENRKKVLWIHDVNHLVTGYSTKWIGESSVSGWELATGGWGSNFFVWMIIMGGFLIGVIGYPKSTFRAFVRGRKCAPVLSLGLSKRELMMIEVDEIKQKLGTNKTIDNQVNTPDVIHYVKWIFVALTVYLLPLILILSLVF